MLIKTVKFLIACLVFVLIVDPGDLIFRLKIPLFALVFLVWFGLKLYQPIKVNFDVVYISLIFFFIPLVGISVGLLQNTMQDFAFALGFVKSFSIIVLTIVIFDLNININKYLIWFCLAIPLIIIPIYYFITSGNGAIAPIVSYLTKKDVAKFSNRDFYGYKVIMLYYRTSPLLVFPLAYYFKNLLYGNSKFIAFILVALFFVTLILSGTRANMVAGVFVIGYLLFYFLKNRKNKLAFILVSIGLIFASILFLKSLSFDQRDASADVKSGHYNSYKQVFDNHPEYLLWGQGLGSKFYSSGSGAELSQTELTYFDLVRWFGIPLAIGLFFLLLYPVIYLVQNKRITKNNLYLIVAYLAYLFIAGTNPLLVSSTGMLVILTMYSFLRPNSLVHF